MSASPSASRHLAIFDLDDTLLDGDCTGLWLHWLVECGWVADGERFLAEVARQDTHYRSGELDMDAHLRFVLSPLVGRHRDEVNAEVERFVASEICPRLMQPGLERLAGHRRDGHATLIISASMRHLVEPIARFTGADDALATRPAFDDADCFTGHPSGTVTYRDGKLQALEEWLMAREAEHARPTELWGYSDSHNDLPLLEHVDHPHATQADPQLREIAEARGWPILQWR
ncbi:HAD family hydrolase [Halomonas shantousis]